VTAGPSPQAGGPRAADEGATARELRKPGAGDHTPPPPESHGWLTRERVLAGALTLATLAVAYAAWQVLEPFVAVLTWAFVFAVLLEPLHEKLRKRMVSRPIVAALVVLLGVAAVTGPIVFLTQQVAREIAVGADRVRAGVSGDRWRETLDATPRLAAVADWIEQQVDVRAQVEATSQQVLDQARAVLKRSIFVAIGALMTLYVLFYFLRDQELIRGALRRHLPLARHEADHVFRAIVDTIRGVVFGTIVVSMLQGALGGLMFWWLGLPSPLMWGGVMALLSILPWGGAAIVWGPAAVMLAFNDQWQAALILTAWGAIVIGLIDNVLRPVLVRGRMRMHTIVVFVAMLGGLSAFGATGLVLGPIVFAAAFALLDIWRARMAEGEAVEDGIDPK
jgi:predicted PurR-regulated permease PerM